MKLGMYSFFLCWLRRRASWRTSRLSQDYNLLKGMSGWNWQVSVQRLARVIPSSECVHLVCHLIVVRHLVPVDIAFWLITLIDHNAIRPALLLEPSLSKALWLSSASDSTASTIIRECQLISILDYRCAINSRNRRMRRRSRLSESLGRRRRDRKYALTSMAHSPISTLNTTGA